MVSLLLCQMHEQGPSRSSSSVVHAQGILAVWMWSYDGPLGGTTMMDWEASLTKIKSQHRQRTRFQGRKKDWTYLLKQLSTWWHSLLLTLKATHKAILVICRFHQTPLKPTSVVFLQLSLCRLLDNLLYLVFSENWVLYCAFSPLILIWLLWIQCHAGSGLKHFDGCLMLGTTLGGLTSVSHSLGWEEPQPIAAKNTAQLTENSCCLSQIVIFKLLIYWCIYKGEHVTVCM